MGIIYCLRKFYQILVERGDDLKRIRGAFVSAFSACYRQTQLEFQNKEKGGSFG
jgi:hypothetical protein